MSIEWTCDPKFRYDWAYSPDDFRYRCAVLMVELPTDDPVRELLAVYIGWASGLSYREQIRWIFEQSGSVVPYVRRGNRYYFPNGEHVDIGGKIASMVEYGVIGNEDEREAAYQLRNAVFVGEQKVPEDMELDEFDAEAVHAVAIDEDGRVVGTGRLVVQEDRGRIGRMAVQKERRKEGIGGGLMAVLEKEAVRRGLSEIYLHAQVHAKDFYAKMGYVERGGEFDEAGIAHIEMYKNLKLAG